MPAIPPGIRLLMAINVAVFVANMFVAGELCVWLGLTWPGLWEYWGLGLVRLVTYQFTHSYDSPWHLIWNLVSLYIFGGIVEGILRTDRTIRLYILCGIAGGLLQLGLAAIFGVHVPLVGASGACYGLMIYAACLAPNMRFLFGIPLWLIAFVFCLVALYNVHLQFVLKGLGRVADGAHLGGALWGGAAYKLDRTTTFLDRWRDGWKRWRRGKAMAREAQKEASLDQVLAKVKEHGISSLSAAERRVLDRASKELRAR